MKIRQATALLFALTVGVIGARATAEDMAGTEQSAMGVAGAMTVSATVTAIDQASREVTLVDADGETFTVSVGDEVKNLAQVEVGDQVDLAYYEAVTVEVLGTDEEDSGVATSSAMDTAQPGEKPGAVAASEVSVVATVEGIDKDAGTVTLLGPEGNSRTVKVRNPENLEKVKVDDRLLITYTQAVAVGVSAASAED